MPIQWMRHLHIRPLMVIKSKAVYCHSCGGALPLLSMKSRTRKEHSSKLWRQQVARPRTRSPQSPKSARAPCSGAQRGMQPRCYNSQQRHMANMGGHKTAATRQMRIPRRAAGHTPITQTRCGTCGTMYTIFVVPAGHYHIDRWCGVLRGPFTCCCLERNLGKADIIRTQHMQAHNALGFGNVG